MAIPIPVKLRCPLCSATFQARAMGSSYFIAGVDTDLRETGSIEIAERLIDSITDRFALLGKYPHAGRHRNDLRPGLRGFPVGSYVILYRVEGEDALILRVVHGRRDLTDLSD